MSVQGDNPTDRRREGVRHLTCDYYSEPASDAGKVHFNVEVISVDTSGVLLPMQRGLCAAAREKCAHITGRWMNSGAGTLKTLFQAFLQGA